MQASGGIERQAGKLEQKGIRRDARIQESGTAGKTKKVAVVEVVIDGDNHTAQELKNGNSSI
jgi:hypothetical protein